MSDSGSSVRALRLIGNIQRLRLGYCDHHLSAAPGYHHPNGSMGHGLVIVLTGTRVYSTTATSFKCFPTPSFERTTLGTLPVLGTKMRYSGSFEEQASKIEPTLEDRSHTPAHATRLPCLHMYIPIQHLLRVPDMLG